MEVLSLKEELVSFRGIKEGIYIFIKKGDFKNIKKELQEKLIEYKDFYNGASILGIKSENLREEEIKELLHLIEDKFELYIEENGLPSYLEEEHYNIEINEGMTRFYNTTIRSGQIIEYNGNIVIIGDVNPGALVRATGNIVILGKLRGVAHAGIDGNKNTYVAAYELQPTQLRIGDIIARKPDEGFAMSNMPEVAKVYKGEVLIQPYLAKKQ
ncbi:MAG: septum site-determining protein MinC [Tissierellia bacterium]|nr:septum site-determining protein MinC [Tissierellia bacterium]